MLTGDFQLHKFVASDGAFEGRGNFLCSYKDPGNDLNKVTLNNPFREVCALKESIYQRVGAQFPC